MRLAINETNDYTILSGNGWVESVAGEVNVYQDNLLVVLAYQAGELKVSVYRRFPILSIIALTYLTARSVITVQADDVVVSVERLDGYAIVDIKTK